ncbi:ADP-glyceromanno-heptose 6-epimerase [Mucilaginibacter sp. PPCGB 2223]|uniref:ADP-glyceromanno-heptose 6-epimerase n=1 Tax=Mucilaginibacter sp. PPCGB 2223 TaxID=1886027 RepID=UPI000825233E|nr:ADP-glyceromanno-heptose 6-epimerase [Mucilaginibacter sp. PPCGB 2223]OCX53936.1 ADP-glyceromanno-heptose 6-epimerase [Mucilaginibacter sp. PPCGB 2223]
MNTNFNNKNILITGGAGFVGSNIAFYLQKNYPDSNIVVFDKFQSSERFPSGNHTALGHFKNLRNFAHTVISGDINNPDDLALLNAYSWDYIFHQAAISDTTVMDQSLVIKTNTNTLKFFIDLAARTGAHLVYASSAGTYGNSEAPNRVGYGEHPENVYGFSKLMMDNITRDIIPKTPLAKITGLRYFNVYGNAEYYKGKTASMILQLGLQMLSNNKVKLFKYGEQLRDFVFIDDVVQANIKAVDGKPGIYNVGYGKSRSFNDIVSVLSQHLNKKVEVEYIDNPFTFYQNNTCADITATSQNLGYLPEFTLEKGIAAYIDEIQRIHEQIR